MNKLLLVVLIIVVILLGGFWSWQHQIKPDSQKQKQNNITSTTMQITSPAFTDQQSIPNKFTCDGDNINPPLEFKDMPAAAKSLALIVDDPDAPVGTWTHWTLWNIGPTTHVLSENSVPEGAIQGKTSSGQNVFGGPCPPTGTHHYFFKLYALDNKLDLPSYSTVDKLTEAMQGHIIEEAQLVGLYSRNQ